ncbi:aquaporin [Candidatus Babeliales bacterium]|nr:aquaporin [Candidatus Babeliales bacterium]
MMMLKKTYLAELVGTFFLTFAVCLTGNPLAIGLILTAMIYIGKNASGAHFNPAITLAAWFKGKFKNEDLCWYLASQTIGAFLACVLFFVLSHNTYSPHPLDTIKLWEALLIEALFSFILVSVWLTLDADKTKGGNTDGLIIGLTLTAILFCAGELTGSTFNPATGVGALLLTLIKTGPSSLMHLVTYLVGPLLGALLATLFQKKIS